MSMIDWAKREIELACKKENPDREPGEWDYGCACYESALKAYESLMEDGHSGMSISITKHILNRLIDGQPLTPIEDVEDVWNECARGDLEYKTYQCKRMHSLFKYVYPNGVVKYNDIDRITCVDINNPEITYRNGFISKIMYDQFPITMPYIPDTKPYKVYVEDFLFDPKNGDYDTLGIWKCVTPNGETKYIYRYFKESSSGWEEISSDEWCDRQTLSKGEKK